MTRPLLLISDAPSGSSGLARITGDLASRIHEHMPEFRVATLGSNGTSSSRFTWPQYNMNPTTDWLITELPEVLNDFVRDGERPIIMTIWDATRLSWLAQPALCPDTRLRGMVERRDFDLYGYFPLDADTFGEKIGFIARETISKFDRVLMYSEWAADVVGRSLPTLQRPQALPHGIDDIFHPRDRQESRSRFQGLPVDALLIGIVATNQARKDWALGLEVVAKLARRDARLIQGRPVFMWIHTDSPTRHWDIFGILYELGLTQHAIITDGNIPDEEMAFMYSACDVTLGIGAGEGFGYPIFESIACGTPCIHGNYAGAPEYMPAGMLVEPIAFRYDGLLANRRPVFAVEDWVKIVECNLQNRVTLPLQLRWSELWPRFERWFREGLETPAEEIGPGHEDYDGPLRRKHSEHERT